MLTWTCTVSRTDSFSFFIMIAIEWQCPASPNSQFATNLQSNLNFTNCWFLLPVSELVVRNPGSWSYLLWKGIVFFLSFDGNLHIPAWAAVPLLFVWLKLTPFGRWPSSRPPDGLPYFIPVSVRTPLLVKGNFGLLPTSNKWSACKCIRCKL